MIELFGIHVTLFQVFATVVGIGLLIFIHELGHFATAKWFGIRVEKFALGFGPELLGYSYGGTRYSLCAIPLGGMVKMPGEDIDSATGSPDEFLSQPWYKRLVIAFFGPLMNYLLAIVIFTCVLYFWGMSKPSDKAVIGEVIAGYPAEKSGLKQGDLVVAVDGLKVSDWGQMAGYVHKYPEKKVRFQIVRGEEKLEVFLNPVKAPSSGYGVIGISPLIETEEINIIDSAYLSCKMVFFQSVYTLQYLGMKIIKWEKPEVAGPIGVIQIIAKAADTGWESLLQLLAVISVALGLFNLLPIPLVDGGHIFMSLIEGVIRKPINKRIIMTSNVVGLTIILTIFVFATYSDIVRLVN